MARKKPIIVINLKTYKQGKDSLKIASSIEKVDKKIIIGVQPENIYEIAKKTKLKVYSQHVDYFEPSRYTGYIIPEAVKKAGAKGTFLNHSEHKLKFRILKKTIKRCKQIKLKTLAFASNLKEAKKIQKLKPDYLVIEPPELVGGRKSVSKYRPQLIKNIKKNLKIPFLVGAGIHTKQDVKIALKLGASGIAVSSAITKAKKPAKKLRELINVED